MYILQIILVMFGRVLEVAVFARNVRRFGACRKGKLGMGDFFDDDGWMEMSSNCRRT